MRSKGGVFENLVIAFVLCQYKKSFDVSPNSFIRNVTNKSQC